LPDFATADLTFVGHAKSYRTVIVIPETQSPDIRQFAQEGVEQDSEEHDVGLEKISRVHGHVTDAVVGRDCLGDDQGQLGDAKRVAHADEDRG
jgi:hypothetical protein